MAERKTIATLWDEYTSAVFRGMQPEAMQIYETRKAFYAGAFAFLQEQMVALDPGREPTESDLEWMTDILDELEAFHLHIIALENPERSH